MTLTLPVPAPAPPPLEPGDLGRTVCANALFASPLDPSACPARAQVMAAVAAALARHGTRGCAVRVAGEFGDHPEAAAGRMRWALAAVTA